jgi:hypothetical protein
MSDYEQNFTPRAFLRYRTLGKVHTMKARLPRGATPEDLQGAVDKLGAILSANPTFRYADWSVLSAGYLQQSTGLSFPLSVPTVAAGTLDPAAQKAYSKFIQVRFEARASTGARSNLTIFGCNIDLDTAAQSDMRVAATEATFPTALWTGLSEVSPSFVAIDGGLLTWYPYFNIKLNDHFMGQLRG